MRRDTKIAAAALVPLPLLVLGAATLCTWAVAAGASERWRLLFRVMCHGIVERCLVVWDVPMPICARCTAMYAGLAAGFIVFLLMPWLEEKWLKVAAWAGALPMLVDGLTQAARLRESTNGLRIATGLLAGFFFGMWVLSAIERRRDATFTVS